MTTGPARSRAQSVAQLVGQPTTSLAGVPGPSRAPSGDRAPARTGRPTTPLRRFGRCLGTESRPRSRGRGKAERVTRP
jgi:hypothetical protein